jgi:hypothetical protein
MNFFSGMMSGGNGNIFMQAVGAFMRGESPQEFMRQLANTNPALRGINLDDLNGEAERICREHGQDPAKLTAEIKQKIGK